MAGIRDALGDRLQEWTLCGPGAADLQPRGAMASTQHDVGDPALGERVVISKRQVMWSTSPNEPGTKPSLSSRTMRSTLPSFRDRLRPGLAMPLLVWL